MTQKQENFALNLFKGMSQREAYVKAGYSSRQSMKVIDNHACELAKTGGVKMRLEEFNQKSTDDSILTKLERKQRLSLIAKEDNPGQHGLARQSNISAIDILNKMDRVYQDSVSVSNQTINILVMNEEAKELTEKILSGVRTEDAAE